MASRERRNCGENIKSDHFFSTENLKKDSEVAHHLIHLMGYPITVVGLLEKIPANSKMDIQFVDTIWKCRETPT